DGLRTALRDQAVAQPSVRDFVQVISTALTMPRKVHTHWRIAMAIYPQRRTQSGRIGHAVRALLCICVKARVSKLLTSQPMAGTRAWPRPPTRRSQCRNPAVRARVAIHANRHADVRAAALVRCVPDKIRIERIQI